MEIKLNGKGYKKYLIILRILSSMKEPEIKPFSELRNRELEVLAILMWMHNEKYESIPEEDRNRLIFSYDGRIEISTMLGDISVEIVYNIMMSLRKKNIIDKKQFNKKYLLKNQESFKILFINV
jgi:hypothetical protein